MDFVLHVTEKTLYVANGMDNALAVIKLGNKLQLSYLNHKVV